MTFEYYQKNLSYFTRYYAICSFAVFFIFTGCKKDKQDPSPQEILTEASLVKVDAGFERELIRLGIDKSGKEDGLLLYRDVMNVDSLYIKAQSREEIQGLKGIEYFTNLKSFTTLFTKPDSMDFSKNTKLEYLHIQTGLEVGGERNALKYLNIRNCKELKYLKVQNNLISELDVSQNTKLVELYCDWNYLKALDISSNRELEVLVTPTSEEFSTLDLKNNLKLRTLVSNSRGLKELDISMLTDLEFLSAGIGDLNLILGSKPKLESLLLNNANMVSLDLSKAPNIESLQLGGGLKFVDLTPLKNLKSLNLQSSLISELDLSQNSKLETMGISSASLRSLDFSKNLLLKVFYGTGMKELESLDLRNSKNLERFQIFDVPKLNIVCVSALPAASDVNWMKPEQVKFEICK